MFKREIKPLAEGMAESISKSINRLQHIEEKASRPADSAEGDVKPQDISGEEEVKADGSAAKAPARKGDKAVSESYNESSCVGEMKQLHASSCSKNEMYEKVSKKYGIDKAKFEELYAQYCSETVKEDNTNDKSDDGEGLDKVQPKAVKKKFADRKDKDIDNDGDTDDSDEYLHKRRKAISKALESKKPEASVDESAELEGLDEGNMASAAKELETYARKNGGIDKGDFMKAAVMMKKGQKPQLMKFVDNLDTEPREKILSVMQSHMKEEVELEEKVNVKGIQKAIDDGKSMDAIMTMFANKRTTNTDEIRKVAKDYMWKKRMKKEEVELDENMIASLAKDFEKRLKKAGNSDRNQNRERMATLAMAKKKGASALDMKNLDKAMISVMNRLDEAEYRVDIEDHGRATVQARTEKEAHQKARRKLGIGTIRSRLGRAFDPKVKITKIKEDLDEAKKSDYTIYHKTFSSAVQHAAEVVKKRGYEVDDDSWDRKVAMGPRKPGKGKTNSYTIDLMKGGKPVRNKLQMQVYFDEGRYELNMYIS
jgi:hypothetical protein